MGSKGKLRAELSQGEQEVSPFWGNGWTVDRNRAQKLHQEARAVSKEHLSFAQVLLEECGS